MKPISLHLPEGTYKELKSLAQRQRRPIAQLIRQAMAEYLYRDRRAGRSLLEVRAHRSGRLRKGWTRAEIADELIG